MSDDLVVLKELPAMSTWVITGVKFEERSWDMSPTHGQQFLVITFNNGHQMELVDAAPYWSSNRSITTDDDLSSLVGSRLVSVRIANVVRRGVPDDAAPDSESVVVPEDEGYWSYRDIEETAFVIVQTTSCAITLCTHNDHDGFYGGFELEVRICLNGKVLATHTFDEIE